MRTTDSPSRYAGVIARGRVEYKQAGCKIPTMLTSLFLTDAVMRSLTALHSGTCVLSRTTFVVFTPGFLSAIRRANHDCSFSPHRMGWHFGLLRTRSGKGGVDAKLKRLPEAKTWHSAPCWLVAWTNTSAMQYSRSSRPASAVSRRKKMKYLAAHLQHTKSK